MSGAPDFAVVGGGIVGCSLAAFLAEAGARVVVYEREAIAAGASGRNSGVVQHPLDPALVDLYEESMEHYSTLGRGFELPADAVGLLLVTDDPDTLEPEPSEFPELEPTLLEGAELRAAEPTLADGLVAWRLDTGRPVPPAAAAHAFATRAREAGAEFRIGEPATLALDGTRATGVTVGGELHPAGAVAIAAGPWTPETLDHPKGGLTPLRVPIAPLWGVVVELELPDAPTHVLEETGIKALTQKAGAPRVLVQRGDRARDQRGRFDLHAREARSGGARAGAAGERHAVPARAERRQAARAASMRAAELGGRVAVPRPVAGPGGRERGERPRRVGDHAGAGVGPARGRSAAGAAG